jgi:hypothetical protein
MLTFPDTRAANALTVEALAHGAFRTSQNGPSAAVYATLDDGLAKLAAGRT